MSGERSPGGALSAAVVLAAGFSSRMGAFKPLLPFGKGTVVSHVVATLRSGGLDRIHIVVGHRAEEMRPTLTTLGATVVDNPRYAEGMLSSIQAGLASLPEDAPGCLLLPVDVALVRPATVRQMLDAAESSGAPLLHPTFRGEKGHPPYIRRATFGEILAYSGEGGLASVLARHEREAETVPVIDAFCLADMDTKDAYRQRCADLGFVETPTEEECEAMLEAARTPAPVRAHSRVVAALADAIAQRLISSGLPLDEAAIRAGALLHDIAKGQPRHAEAGARMVSGFGFPRIAPIVASHMTFDFGGQLDEAAVVFLADKLVSGVARTRLEDRFAPALSRFRDDPRALAGALARMASAKAALAAIEVRIGPLDDPRAPAAKVLEEA
ncbi:DVU_1551 family NTP transferase [Consotaella salsifontis]|uniref:HDIG domain-containing protein n=1 Tax=Consotaella salsifontis TaxID=1365950 RepID=A0A1T4MIM2_9HYPH|nr:NTP transferase domain-containing protein [Consotaella salsifontis]SJZ66624.1 HDIG domain-containing protein [Consotaella salsifontis]